LKEQGIKFEQQESLVTHPIQNFIDHYQKQLKKELRVALDVEFVD
jgi:hypothetical protein